jgi:TetR/AcrR family transcriptional repressor of nem operon
MPRSRGAKQKLLDASLSLIREKGFAATTLDDLCARASVTKGAFFHHFESKEALGVAAAQHWSEVTGALFQAAPYHAPTDALERVLAYVDFRKALLRGAPPEFTCVVGTMVQETHESHPAIRQACAASILGHARTLESDIEQAMKDRGIVAAWTPQSLAFHTQAVLQGAFILAKATGDAATAAESVDHLRRYVELLFQKTASTRSTP